ncbi:MAG: YbhB/YbcL family Raf kinase inhibitor-like protein [Bacteroidetes bacterium]|jgi:Raf kinase inhibitor-like YbhB/YbcL family protein|nr:YbhB/YbcL family Raf kinase inhibitor-like protein [Bacteroidota bacterium]
MAFKIESKVFQEGGMIPTKYTCDGENISPPLKWLNAPESTKSFALLLEDPDAPTKTWSHWVLYNIPANQTGLRERIQNLEKFDNGAMHGINDFKKYGYGGPCPPSGTHRYIFKLYALKKPLELEPGATRKQLLDAMEGQIIKKKELTGRYKRE